ncbi:hypothetical protein ACF0H5_019256 [Mactra antiquata]
MENITTLNETRREEMCKMLNSYALAFWSVHPYITLVICAFGIPTNIVNIVILNQKKMRSSINCILTAIAVSDIITMADYVPYTVFFYIITGLSSEDIGRRRSFGWTYFLAVHSCLSITTHTLSLWLAVLMSTVRYFFIKTSGRWNLNIVRTRLAIVGIFIGTVVLSCPLYALTDLVPAKYENATIYRIRGVQIYYNETSIMDVLNVWLHIVVGKVLPCCLICVFGCLLLQTLRKSQQLSENLKLTSTSRRMRAHKRTTRMLLAIMTMFIISALPAAVLTLVSVFVEHFFTDCYLLLGDSLDFLSLINNSINFIMYCIMSRQFRDCLCEAFPMCGNKFIHAQYRPATSVNSTGRPSTKNCNL